MCYVHTVIGLYVYVFVTVLQYPSIFLSEMLISPYIDLYV